LSRFCQNQQSLNFTETLISIRSDHAPLTIDISISEEFIQDKQCTIIRNSKKEEKFVISIKNTIGNINTLNILSNESLKELFKNMY